jgi:hypothetical protein
MDLKQAQQSSTTPLRLQAYERLMLFCERISIPNLMLRLQKKKMSVEDLKMAMMVTVQKEYEHNVTQQVYVSDNLWKIISLAKDDVLNIINVIADRLDQGEDAQLLRESLMVHLQSNADTIVVEKAKFAIKKEIGLIL